MIQDEKHQDQKPESRESADLGAEFESAKSEAAEFKDKYLRVLAEMDNMRKRFDRERQELSQYGLEKIMTEILPVLDSFDRALPEGDSAQVDEKVISGLQMVKKQLTEVLSKHGLESLSALNEAFDPNLHQAIQRQDSEEVDRETVSEEYARGYKLNGRLLRPAIVKVMVPPDKA